LTLHFTNSSKKAFKICQMPSHLLNVVALLDLSSLCCCGILVVPIVSSPNVSYLGSLYNTVLARSLTTVALAWYRNGMLGHLSMGDSQPSSRIHHHPGSLSSAVGSAL
jgi:hypothetical protein